jgi:hypothetical protein
VHWRELIDIPWIIFVVYWVIAGFRTRRAETKEPASSRYGVMVLLLIGYSLVFSERLRIGFAGERVVPARSQSL